MAGLDDFFAGAKPVAPSSPGVTTAPPRDQEAPASAEPAVPADEQSGDDAPFGVVEIETPSGIQVYYQAGPKRLYRLRQLLQEKEEFFEWREVRSISKLSDALDKPGLVHWGEKVGINLAQEILREGWADHEFATRFVPNEDRDPPWFGGQQLLDIGKTKKLTNHYMKEIAADRGTSVHQALEGWAMSGTLADPHLWAEHERRYVVGLNKFLTESKIEPVMSEVIVASVTHEIAGRFDLIGRLPEEVSLIKHVMPKSERRGQFPASERVLVDLKTSKGVYPDHHFQVAAYQGALIDSGYDPTEFQYVLRVTRDGRYEFIKVQAEWTDVWFLLGINESLHRIEQADRAERK